MLSQEAAGFSKLMDVNLEQKLKPVNNTVDQMLTRLEELETMLTIVQQENCNATGLTGSLTDVVQLKGDLLDIGQRINTLETLVEHIANNMGQLEDKVQVAEDQFGLQDNATKLKSLFTPLFKKGVEPKEAVDNKQEMFCTEEYFSSSNEAH